MSAIPLRQEEPQTCILKLYNTSYTLDPYHDRLVSQGYQVIDVNNYDEAQKSAHICRPALILVYDDPQSGVDAVQWIERQHSDREAWMATTPILVLADAARMPDLRVEALPDRVVILQRRSDTLNQLTRTVNRLLRIMPE